MTDKVYGVVVGGEFSEKTTIALFLKEKDRDKYLEKFIASDIYIADDGARAEDFPLNPDISELLYVNITSVNLYKNGKINKEMVIEKAHSIDEVSRMMEEG